MVGLVTARREPHPPLVEALIRNAGRSAPEDAA